MNVKKGPGILKILKKDINEFVVIEGDWDSGKVRGSIIWDSQNKIEKSLGNFTVSE